MDAAPQPTSSDRVVRTLSLALLAADVLLMALISYRIFRTRGSFIRMLADFDMQWPLVSSLVLSRWYPWILPSLAAVGIAKEWLLKNRLATLIWNAAYLAIAAAVWQLYVEGAMEPLFQLMEKLSFSCTH